MTEPAAVPQRKKSNWWWPEVGTLEQARAEAMGGVAVACIIAAVTSGFALYAAFQEPVLNITVWSFVDAFLFGAIAIGLWRLSRVAAVAGLLLYLFEQGYQWATIGPKAPVMAVFFILFLVHAVRGTFSHHNLRKLVTPVHDAG